MVLSLLLACTAPASEDDSDASATDSGPPTPWEYWEDEREAVLTAAQVEAAINATLPSLLAIDPYPLYAAYSMAMARQSPGCPDPSPVAGVDGWRNDCTAQTGWRFQGRSQALHVFDTVINGRHYSEYGSLLDDSVMTSPDGERLQIVGYSDLWDYQDDGWQTVYAYFLGVFHWDGPNTEDSWLRDDLSLGFTTESGSHPELGRWRRIDGGVAWLPGALPTLRAESFIQFGEDTGASCTLEPGGALELRTDDGLSYSIRFQGSTSLDDQVAAEDCDGCGEVSFRGEVLGAACPDTSGMLDWQVRPW